MIMRTVVVIEPHTHEDYTKEKITIFDNTTIMSEKIWHYKDVDECTHYIVKDYHLNYPTDYKGEQMIHELDVVWPQNHLWVDRDERISWIADLEKRSDIYFPTYGRCDNCWASGPAYKLFIECKDEPDEYGDQYSYQMIACRKETLILDSQTIAEKSGRPHETAKANRMIQIVAATWHDFNSFGLHRQIEAKHKHIKDDEERKRMIFKRCNEFMKDYAPIHSKFMEDYKCDIYLRGIWRQQDCVGRNWNPEENLTTNETNENPTKKTFSRDTTKERWENIIDTIREEVPGDAHSLSWIDNIIW
jgi:hypothetical protein